MTWPPPVDGISSLSEMHRAGAAFLIADLKLSLTLLSAVEYLNIEKRALNYQNARCAYQSVNRIRRRIALTARERQLIDELLTRLEARIGTEEPRS
jgi:hypothetical protein